MWQLQTWEVTKLVHSSLTEQYVAKMLYNSCVWSDGFHKGSFLVCGAEECLKLFEHFLHVNSQLIGVLESFCSTSNAEAVYREPWNSPHSTVLRVTSCVQREVCSMCHGSHHVSSSWPRHSHAPILGVALLATMPLCTSWCTYKQTAESRDEEWSKAADRAIAIVTKRGHEAEARLPN